jgi:hypothetical protein
MESNFAERQGLVFYQAQGQRRSDLIAQGEVVDALENRRWNKCVGPLLFQAQ